MRLKSSRNIIPKYCCSSHVPLRLIFKGLLNASCLLTFPVENNFYITILYCSVQWFVSKPLCRYCVELVNLIQCKDWCSNLFYVDLTFCTKLFQRRRLDFSRSWISNSNVTPGVVNKDAVDWLLSFQREVGMVSPFPRSTFSRTNRLRTKYPHTFYFPHLFHKIDRYW